VFTVLLTRVVLAFDLALYIPLSRVDENMRRAHMKDSINTHKFYFRKHVAAPAESEPEQGKRHLSMSVCMYMEMSLKSNYNNACIRLHTDAEVGASLEEMGLENMKTASSDSKPGAGADGSTPGTPGSQPASRPPPCKRWAGADKKVEDQFEEMTMDEIFNGKSDYYPGLIPLVYAYLEYINTDRETFKRVAQYLQFISRRAKGEIMTTATWMRDFVTKHPAYNKDSVISHEVAYDLLVACKEIGEGVRPCPEILGDVEIDR
jgi:glutamate--cysteine ligase catalytic subunit